MGIEDIKAQVQKIQEEKLEKKGIKVVKEDIQAAEFEWIKLNQELAGIGDSGTVQKGETSKEKFYRKFQENPLVPIGAGLTAGCLMLGLGKFARKDSAGSQTMMRGRIAAQAITVMAMLIGVSVQMKKQMAKSSP
ncbi:HIG1 domain family member 2A, mitochondrial [Eurytemora carolleeae]|uniref:HIG1 domain family member 2A, mitochondrial n=1 Tax=Eurytemora carolleeae TaxID=1294199 RepID=UPI000C772C92|nr:HIG1 domain family member 2A, mitochondrial [Eurytemora carolleeae]|eukprot:XP_023345085.1 HIG1 domain family member 2A, mitochondrial-like [Eurytemora affinis]